MIDLKAIKKQLNRLGIFVDEGSLKLHFEQGLVNEVYTVNSNKGNLIIHIGKASKNKIQLQKAKRIFALSEFLKKNPKIPSVEVITFGKDSKGRVFVVQNFVEGKRLSEIKDKVKHLKQLAGIVAQIHQINIEKGGYLKFKSGQLKGMHKDWFIFLKKQSYKSLKELLRSKKISKAKYNLLKSKLEQFFQKYKDYFTNIKGKLLHSDLVLENILVNNKKITALIDLEWSCSGDPAWDFVGPEHLFDVVLPEYFKELRKLGLCIDEEAFRFKIKLYWVIKYLFVVETLKQDKDFEKRLSLFEKRLDELL